jgi:protein-disulfide isomerase
MKKIVFIVVVGLLCTQAFAETKRFTIPLENSPSLGPQDAPVTIVEFIDYQ